MTGLITKPWPFNLETLRVGETAWHAYETKYGPLSANPYSNGRYALPRLPRQKAAAAAFYIAKSPIGALWETLLNNSDPGTDGTISVAQRVPDTWSVARIELRRDIPNLMRVDRQYRLRFVHPDDAADKAWAGLCTTAPHALTQTATDQVRGYLADKDRHVVLAGIGWHSRQWPDDVAHVLYDPPVSGDFWVVRQTLQLNSPAGRAYLELAVTQAGFTLDTVPNDAP